jgi:hypothetical protein
MPDNLYFLGQLPMPEGSSPSLGQIPDAAAPIV